MKLFKSLIAAFFPNICACCKEIIPEGEFLCDYCFEMLDRCSKDKLCLKCGNLKSRCECKNKVFCFDAVIAPFFNENSAKKAIYAFKIGKREQIAEFFINEMVLSVKQYYRDINFDAVCFVPMYKRDELRKGFDHSRILAEGISDKLKIPVIEALSSRRKRKPQHFLHPKERAANVKDIYYCKMKLSGKTVLLVDDIKTTAATLDECARQLLLSGAERVYCVAGVMSKGKKR